MGAGGAAPAPARRGRHGPGGGRTGAAGLDADPRDPPARRRPRGRLRGAAGAHRRARSCAGRAESLPLGPARERGALPPHGRLRPGPDLDDRRRRRGRVRQPALRVPVRLPGGGVRRRTLARVHAARRRPGLRGGVPGRLRGAPAVPGRDPGPRPARRGALAALRGRGPPRRSRPLPRLYRLQRRRDRGQAGRGGVARERGAPAARARRRAARHLEIDLASGQHRLSARSAEIFGAAPFSARPGSAPSTRPTARGSRPRPRSCAGARASSAPSSGSSRRARRRAGSAPRRWCSTTPPAGPGGSSASTRR